MSVTKVSDLRESATALDMIGDRTKSIQRKKCACSQIAASNGRAKRFTGWECPQGVVLPYLEVGGLAPNFASEILVGAPSFASKNINDKYPRFCSLNLRYDPKIGTFSQLLRLLVTKLPKFFLLFCELGRTLPQILPPNLM